MKILILGGTGAMGEPLAQFLNEQGHTVYVTSRKAHNNRNNIKFISGNAKKIGFIKEVLNEKYDVIVDFMSYSNDEFAQRVNLFLENTEQYIFLSSARVFDNSDLLINEGTTRLVDTTRDKVFLESYEYAISKGIEENQLLSSAKRNWTIIRPYITYNIGRFQIGIYEKNLWMKRFLSGKSIVFPRDMLQCKTTMTFGDDVSKIIMGAIGNKETYGETINAVSNMSHTWQQVIDIYINILSKEYGINFKVKYVDNSEEMELVFRSQKYQIRYDRLLNRCFDNTKVYSIVPNIEFTELENGLSKCIAQYKEKQEIIDFEIPANICAWLDRSTHEVTSLKEFDKVQDKLKYLVARYVPIPFRWYIKLYFMLAERKNKKGN